MATLTETAYTTRKIIKWGGIGFVAVLVLRILLIAGLAYWNQLHPAAPPPPTVAFGKIPKPVFPAKEIPPLNYNLQLPTGSFPTFSDRAKVFIMPYKTANFLASDEAKRQAGALGFTSAPEIIKPEVYRWTKNEPVISSLQMNIINGSFEYNYSWQEDPNIPLGKNLPTEEQATSETKGFVSRAKTLEQDLQESDNKVVYLKLSGTKLTPSVSFSESDFVRVDLFRKNIDDLPVVTPEPSQGLVSALLSGSTNQRFLKVSNNYFPVDYSQFATYPIKSPTKAWEQLKSGSGFIASYQENNSDIVVRRVYLGFYDTFSPQDYLQPIYIFTGDNDFIGYVPAIDDIWFQ